MRRKRGGKSVLWRGRHRGLIETNVESDLNEFGLVNGIPARIEFTECSAQPSSCSHERKGVQNDFK